VVTDEYCQTSVPGLLVAGEDSGGVHGANRLGGNGVAESTIFGGRAGDRAALVAGERDLRTPDPEQVAASVSRAYVPLRRERGLSPFGVTHRLEETMWEGCGVTRDRDGLLRAREQIEDLARAAGDISIPGPREANYAWQEALDLSNQLTVARAMVESALIREESRGSHYRSDFPDQDDDNWLRFVVTRSRERGGVEADLRSVELSRRSPRRTDPPAEELERVRETKD
jgi:succinate dehydrogenase / fumarate reductase flavoprotein subunit/fumarate reductase flavoprotein subunit